MRTSFSRGVVHIHEQASLITFGFIAIIISNFTFTFGLLEGALPMRMETHDIENTSHTPEGKRTGE